MGNIFISADFHAFHTNICGPKVSQWKSGYRNFDSVKDMNEAIVSSINKDVKYDDILYFLGDWSFGGHENIPKLRQMLNVQNIILVFGNHDQHIRKMYKHLFTETHELLYKKFDKSPLIVMCHNALRVGEGSHRGNICLYGHSHHTLPEIGKSMDVGWCKYRRALPLEEILEIMSKRQIVTVDHHNSRTTQ